jgi:hypothetical protein
VTTETTHLLYKVISTEEQLRSEGVPDPGLLRLLSADYRRKGWDPGLLA